MNPSLYPALKADILADPVLAAFAAQGAQGPIATAYNQTEANYYVWRTSVPTDEVFDAITWANLTPADAATDTAIYTNRALLCQAKQINLQILLQGKDQVNGAKSSIRSGLSDALLNVPSAAGGAPQSAGWAAVKGVLTRNAKRGEKLFANGAGTIAAPSNLVFEGEVTPADIEYAMRG
jgi:hypothetical protein